MTAMQTATEKANKEARQAIEEGDQVARVRSDQNELVNAFRAKHGLEPDDCVVDIRRLPNNRLIWGVRKATVSEREAQRQVAIKRGVEAVKQASGRTYLYGVELADDDRKSWGGVFAALFHKIGRSRRNEVWLTERGAAQECGGAERVVKLEVRA